MDSVAFSGPLGASETFKVTCNADSISVTINGTPTMTVNGITQFEANTKFGMYCGGEVGNSTVNYDNFLVTRP